LVYPAIVFIHGGAWVFGDKSQIYNITFNQLVESGFVVASVNYYLPNSSGISPSAFPLNVEDVACAIRYLRSNALLYKINLNEIGLFGQSAGANIALLIQSANQNSSWFKVGQYQNYSNSVQAVVDQYGPTNLSILNFTPIENYYKDANLETQVIGNQNLSEYSPINFVSKNVSPTLIQQGEKDTIVPESQSISLANSLLSFGNYYKLTLVSHANHIFVHSGYWFEKEKPNISVIDNQVMQFFQTWL
jgi:acetyl esterase/lipase